MLNIFAARLTYACARVCVFWDMLANMRDDTARQHYSLRFVRA